MLGIREELALSIARNTDTNGMTALHLAASAGKTHICKYLIEELKLNVNVKNIQGEVPLHQAALGDHYPTAVYLLKKGADPTAGNDQNITPLHYAVEKGGSKNLLNLLISKEAAGDAEADSGTPLEFAAARGKKDAMKILLENKANPNKILHHLFPPLVVSIIAGSLDCVKLLLKAGADPNIGYLGGKPLTFAASEGKTEMIKALLKANANADVTNSCGFTPIEVAALNGRYEDVMIMYSITSLIPFIRDWSCADIIKYVDSEEVDQHVLSHALSDAYICLSLNSDWWEGYYRQEVA